MTDRQRLALAMAAANGITPIHLRADNETPRLIALGTGSGITMAFADTLARSYPTLSVAVADMPGQLGTQRRMIALDYLAQAFPTVWLIWSALDSTTALLDTLKQRGFAPAHPTWLYLQGFDADPNEWAKIGIRPLHRPWDDNPLGCAHELTELGILDPEPVTKSQYRASYSHEHG